MSDDKKRRTTRSNKETDGEETTSPKTTRSRSKGNGEQPMEAVSTPVAETAVEQPPVAAPDEPPLPDTLQAPVPTSDPVVYKNLPYVTRISEEDMFIFNEGNHFNMYDQLGAHPMTVDGVTGTYFAVWAPDAQYVSVIGDFNGWDAGKHPLKPKGASGIWEGFIPEVGNGTVYKYHVASKFDLYRSDRADPYATLYEVSPKSASVVWDRDYEWHDQEWMQKRAWHNSFEAPISIYEVHIGSWMRVPEDGSRSLSYRELAPRLAEYVKKLNFTHVEFLPVMEHPYYGSWGYQTLGYFAPTSRYGTPQDFMYLVDYLHQHDIGVILDWVPSHFAVDGHGLSYFDGTHLYEHADRRKGFHPDWGSYIFNYGRSEVRSFLLSSAIFWLDKFHVDGLRVDAVASMLYLDYSRKDGEWIPNIYGGNENLEAIGFLRRFNEAIYERYPDVQTYAEESTAWPMVSRPTYVGGLGFGIKWDMGWMHDTLHYMQRDPIHRRFHHNEMTFRGLYAFGENFILPLSHDEIVHGKGSLLDKMPGDMWQKFANLRLLFAYMIAQPAKKLLFMGGEFGQWREWKVDDSLDWHLLEYESHLGVQRVVSDLNRIYRYEPAMHEYDLDPRGMEWIDANDADNSIYVFTRQGKSNGDIILCLFNCTPVVRENYRIGVPRGGWWSEILNSDAKEYWGSGVGNAGGVEATPVPSHNRPASLVLTLPPLSALFFKSQG
jgi:1,4-alpha-glucan branching enzyme